MTATELAMDPHDHGNVLRARRVLRSLEAAGLVVARAAATPRERDGSRSRYPLSARDWRCSETVFVDLMPNRSPISRIEGW